MGRPQRTSTLAVALLGCSFVLLGPSLAAVLAAPQEVSRVPGSVSLQAGDAPSRLRGQNESGGHSWLPGVLMAGLSLAVAGRAHGRRKRLAAAAAKQISFSEDGAIQKMQAGVKKLVNLVGATLGPRGRNVVLEARFGAPQVVNDGVTIAKAVELSDRVEDMGVKVVQQAALKTNEMVGDGTTTVTVLAGAIIEEGAKMLAAGTNPVPLVRGMEKAVPFLVDALRELSQDVPDAAISDVATVSAGNNREIGDMIAKAIAAVGRDGVVTLENSQTAETKLEVVEGLQFDRGYTSPYFVTDTERMVCEYMPCRVFLADRRLSTAADVVPALELAIQENSPLLVVAEDIEGDALAVLLLNRMKGVVNVVAARAPGFGDRRTELLGDMAALSGGTVLGSSSGRSVESVTLEDLGTLAKVRVEKESTTLVGTGVTAAEVKARAMSIRNLIPSTNSDYDKEQLRTRASKLEGGAAVLRVGASTDVELKEKKLRVEDALNATRAALEEGIVAGGGCTLLRLAHKLDHLKAQIPDADEQLGVEILKRSLTAPLRRIADNAGVHGEVVVQKVASMSGPYDGYNAATDAYEDLIAAGILDPTKVTRCVVENAASVAKSFLMSSAVVVDAPEPPSARPPAMQQDF
mmetsp:Transcript_57002/g.152258  ORF Transcript_57002/g.152258 Transcript_57002/m.152258 type:complete len:634 (-) Transcript_57002:23-1924(-)